jgi:hypothetical protein
MTSSRNVTVAAFAAALLLISGAPAGAASTWTVVASPNESGRNFLFGAAAVDATHVWAVGQVVTDSSYPSPRWHGLILRFDGASWRPVARPGFPAMDALYDVDAPAANDAWAVGSFQPDIGRSRTLVAHWDGVAWNAVSTPNANPEGYNNLAGVHAVPSAPGTVWAVGEYSDPASSISDRSLILLRSGGAWRTTPTPRVTSSDFLEAVDATGPADGWAVGWGSNGPYNAPSQAIVLRWNGTAWRSVPVPGASPTAPTVLYDIEALSPTDAWAVGQTYPGGPNWVAFVSHWDGTGWRRAALPATPGGSQLNDVVALSSTNIYTVGTAGDGTTLVLHWDGRSWTREATPGAQYAPSLRGAATVSPATVWAVGDRTDPGAGEERTLTIRTNG